MICLGLGFILHEEVQVFQTSCSPSEGHEGIGRIGSTPMMLSLVQVLRFPLSGPWQIKSVPLENHSDSLQGFSSKNMTLLPVTAFDWNFDLLLEGWCPNTGDKQVPYVYLCIHIYIHIRTYTHTHIYIYTHIHVHIYRGAGECWPIYSQKTKSSLISCFCSRAYGESILQMSSLLSTPHTKCIIWVNLRN